ncbi:MAG: alpha-ribazole phosphatase, partial [Akkermansiaceae bacterium]
MTTWHWVRHGPTHEKTLVGWRDVPADLSDHAQIARLNAHLPRDAILVSSDL